MSQLTFLGAARTVTGSKYLLEHGGSRVLVDCGLFQGLKELRSRNWDDLSVPIDSLHAVVLTHAHLDHVGYLPRLVARGYRGRIFCTGGTEVASGITAKSLPAGHLLRSAYVLTNLGGGATILFGGDLGRYRRPVLPDPADATEADVVLVESTYGDRDHAPDDRGEALAEVIRDTVERGGKLIIPAFAVGRVGELLYWIRHLEHERRIPVLPVYVDSPMATEALRFYTARVAELDVDMQSAEKGVADALRALLSDRLRWDAHTPAHGERIAL